MEQSNNDLQAIVDMGSNGIRFSITNLSPATARNLPTLYQDRAAISLYDAQYPAGSTERQPISANVIRDVVRHFKRFRGVCHDFNVPETNISVYATEATRTALNSQELQNAIYIETQWIVSLLSKEDEAKAGAYGIASSFDSPSGLVMDMGGGSVQLSWIVSTVEGEVNISSSVSLPYGAAALLRRLSSPSEADTLRRELQRDISTAISGLDIPQDARRNGFELYLSGGGFRGWGYALMDASTVSPYPIPIINGFSVTPAEFSQKNIAQSVQSSEEVFRISDRRATQIPAVALLVSTLADLLPSVRRVRFAQGGVREGALFATLRPVVRLQHPLTAATTYFKPHSADLLLGALRDALPTGADVPPILEKVLPAFVNAMYAHASLTKETRAGAALRFATSGGPLASAHGLVHEQRAMLSLMLCERWGADLSNVDKPFAQSLQTLLSSQEVWWSHYTARVGSLLGSIYPAGLVKDLLDSASSRTGPRISISSSYRSQVIALDLDFLDADSAWLYAKPIKKIVQAGKKKKGWVGGYGCKVDVVVKNAAVAGHGTDDDDDDDA